MHHVVLMVLEVSKEKWVRRVYEVYAERKAILVQKVQQVSKEKGVRLV